MTNNETRSNRDNGSLLEEADKEISALMERRLEIKTKLGEIASQLAEFNADKSYKRNPHARRKRAELIRKRHLIETEGEKVKIEIIAATNRKDTLKRQGTRQNIAELSRGRMDEWDLRNALSAPQNLLHRCYVELDSMSRRIDGYTEQRRALLDAVKDYLTRNGILV
jgi:hypothetical protein